VNNRIVAATSAFGALHKCVFATKDISLPVKCAVYIAIGVLSILFGPEVSVWCLSAQLATRLRSFHNKCVRIMCRVTRYQTWNHHISQHTACLNASISVVWIYILLHVTVWPLGRCGSCCSYADAVTFTAKAVPSRLGSPRSRPRGRPRITFGQRIPSSYCEWLESKLGTEWGGWKCGATSPPWIGSSGRP
jgi:hypothetical protein